MMQIMYLVVSLKNVFWSGPTTFLYLLNLMNNIRHRRADSSMSSGILRDEMTYSIHKAIKHSTRTCYFSRSRIDSFRDPLLNMIIVVMEVKSSSLTNGDWSRVPYYRYIKYQGRVGEDIRADETNLII